MFWISLLFQFLKPKSTPIAIFINKLGLLSGLRLSLFTFNQQVESIRYLSISRSGRVIVTLMRRLRPCLEVKKLEIDFSSPVRQGGGLWYWVHAAIEDVARTIAADLMESGTFMEYVAESIEPSRRIGFVRKMLSEELFRTMILVLLAQREAEIDSRLLRKVVFVSVSDLLPLLAKASARWGKDVTFVNLPDWRNSFLLRLPWFLWGKCCVLGWTVIDSLIHKGQENERKPPNTVALQYAWGLESNLRISDIWWYKSSGLDNSRCLIFFNRSKKPATDRVIQELERLGIRYRILNKGANKTSRVPTNQISIQRGKMVIHDVVALVKTLLWAVCAKAPLWQINKWLMVIAEVRRWQAFMEAENVKVIFDVGEFSLDTVSLAADIVGAIKVGLHWSDLSATFSLARLIPHHQVYFIWGPRYQSLLEGIGAPVNALVQVGCIFDDGEARSQWCAITKIYRTRLEGAGARHVIGVLDRSCSPESHIPPTYHIQFYEALLSWAESNVALGLIIKPKYDTPGVFVYKPELYKRFQELMVTGRLLMLEGWRHVAEAALASDIMIALGPNSAGVLCALEGVNTVFWDPSQASKGPFVQWAHRFGWDNGNIVFTRMDHLIDTVKKYLNCPSALPKLGDLSSLLDDVDSFRDGKAALRVGAFIRWFLEGLDQSLNRTEALQIAIDRYRAEWGTDKVHSNLRD